MNNFPLVCSPLTSISTLHRPLSSHLQLPTSKTSMVPFLTHNILVLSCLLKVNSKWICIFKFSEVIFFPPFSGSNNRQLLEISNYEVRIPAYWCSRSSYVSWVLPFLSPHLKKKKCSICQIFMNCCLGGRQCSVSEKQGKTVPSLENLREKLKIWMLTHNYKTLCSLPKESCVQSIRE